MKLAMIGVGKLGSALLKGVVSKKVIPANELGILDANTSRSQQLTQQFGARIISSDELGAAERILICVPPRAFPEVATYLRQQNLSAGYISTMAGIHLTTLTQQLGTQRVVRAMPNLAATIGGAQTALAQAQEDGHDLEFAKTLFTAVGDVYELPEHLFNAFTGMSASGPAYMAVIAEALADGGVRMGLPRPLANELATKLMISSGALIQKYPHAALLKDEVCSAGGTTISGLEKLEAAGVRGALIQAVKAATERGEALGKAQEVPKKVPQEVQEAQQEQ